MNTKLANENTFTYSSYQLQDNSKASLKRVPKISLSEI